MKKHTKIRIFLSTCIAGLAAVFCGVLFSSTLAVEASAETTLAGYKTDGSSVRIYEVDDEGNYNDTTRNGIRFHVEMPMDSVLNGDALIPDAAVTNERNGSFKLADGFKTYTLIIPTNRLSGELTRDTANVMELDTTEYWFKDREGNAESVAYVYGLPKNQYTTSLSFRGIICSVAEDGTETLIASTEVSERCMAYVAKKAYQDTEIGAVSWGEDGALNEDALGKIKTYIPIYNVTYNVDGATTSEEVWWGDAPKKAPTGDFNTWYNEDTSEEINVTETMSYATSQNITLTSTSAAYFTLTGVEYTTSGFNVYATLPTKNFAHETELKPETIDMQKADGTKVSATAVSVIVGGGAGADAISKISISFDYTSISNGDTLTILKSSHFYNEGTLYELELDYDFVYNNKVWELPLGQIVQRDILVIENYTEPGANGVEENIRVTFENDFLVNGNATLSGDGKVYITRKEDGRVDYITNGYYYWNQGANKILEMPQGSNLWGEKNGDVLTIEAGTRLVQNNGYYVFQDTITATFDGGSNWNFTTEEYKIDTSAFTAAYTRQEGNKIYIDVHTATQWADHHVKVVCNDGTLTYHDTDNVTTLDPNEIYYHGENGNQILRIHLDRFSVTGDWVTIPKNTEFWVGNKIYILQEDVISYFVDTSVNSSGLGSTWVTNPTIKEVSKDDMTTIYWYEDNVRYQTSSVWSSAENNRVVVDGTYIEGDGVICEGTTYSRFHYYGGANSLLELKDVTFGENGGSVTLKAGTILWLFNNVDASYTGAYELSEDITIEVSGAAGSQIYKEKEVLRISQGDFVSVYNDGSHGGEIRLHMASVAITKYVYATVEGSATLNGNPTTTAFVYGYKDGTYTGNTIVAFTGEGFGGAFQAATAGDRVKIADGTKLWLADGSGYVYVDGDIEYIYNGSAYAPANAQYTITFNTGAAQVNVNGAPVTSYTVNAGGSVTFSVTVGDGYVLSSVEGATDNGDGTYTIANVIENKTVTVTTKQVIKLTADSISLIEVYNSDSVGYRLHLEKTDEISVITGGNYGISCSQSVFLKLGGVETTPTKYNYFGLIDSTNHQMLEFICDITKMTYGDTICIKQDTAFTVGAILLRAQEDICFIYTQGNEWMAYKDQKLETDSLDILHNVYNDGNELRIVIDDQSETHYGFAYFEGKMTCGSKTSDVVFIYGGNSPQYKGYTIIGFRGVKMEAGDIIIIEEGSKIYVPTGYYEIEQEIRILYDGNTWSIVN
ncbi:MAG: hypothetical protein IJF44_04140 [Clostridia bacterium]|nr:hypothetical protein [Clostridia bacterium]